MAFCRSVSITATPPAVEGDGLGLCWWQARGDKARCTLREKMREFHTHAGPSAPAEELKHGASRRHNTRGCAMIRHRREDQRTPWGCHGCLAITGAGGDFAGLMNPLKCNRTGLRLRSAFARRALLLLACGLLAGCATSGGWFSSSSKS